MVRTLYTIGVYGFGRRSFAAALAKAKVDVLVDLRLRRGLRGREYAFANSNQLQALLKSAGIRCEHALELAPTRAMLEAQHAADRAGGTAIRKRTHLSDAYIKAYRAQRLRTFNAADFVTRHVGDAQRPALFCVEADPEACHRSLLADHLAAKLHVPVKHLQP